MIQLWFQRKINSTKIHQGWKSRRRGVHDVFQNPVPYFANLPFSFPIHLWIILINFLIMWNEKQLFKFVNLLIPLRLFSSSFKWFKIQSLSMQKKRKRNKIKIFFVPKSYTKEPHPQVKWLHSINSANERSKNKHFNIFCLIWAHENGIKC
jgi:hypothetical protein